MTIDEIKIRLIYARNFTPHKIGYYEQMLIEAEENLMQQFKAKQAESYKRQPIDKTIDFQK